MLGPSVKSLIVLMLPRIGTVRMADELKLILPDTPTRDVPVPLASYMGSRAFSVAVEFSSCMLSVPFSPFSGAKNETIPLLPAGHATSNRGPMILRLLVERGLVTTT